MRLVVESGADLVLNALVGSAGLGPTVATLGEGIDLALANKESLVVGGELVRRAGRSHGRADRAGRLRAHRPAPAAGRAAPGRGGAPDDHRQRRPVPRAHTRSELEDVTVEQALAHPTWAMGGKITIDSATLMNKGLELMEAHHLFGTPYERIDVVVHPQSLVHGLSQLADGAMLAHLGPRTCASRSPTRCTAARAWICPDRARSTCGAVVRELDVRAGRPRRVPCLRLAREAALAGGTAPCVLNAANEVAVHAFLEGRLRFIGIPQR